MVHKFAEAHHPPAHQPGQISAGPLGLMAFGMTTLMLMYVEAGWLEPGFVDVVVCYAIFFGGAAQLLAGMWEMACGRTFSATAFSSYGCFWLGFGILRVLKQQSLHDGGFAWGPSSAGFETGEALFLAQWGVMSLLYFTLTFKKPRALQFIFLTVTIAFFLLAGGHANPGSKVAQDSRVAGGYVGLLCAASAVYLSIGEMQYETYGIRWPGCTV
ncbi:GPR1/FUN34/yaaH family-domain-containing protein [Tribonema minus]|uniref:GPR1/FUN34/yaaH family-domain-containing protein n=1 Tax=Tribonema minus TaxID=303371 RepID=A0A835YR69_9STRA|nr:GPR1/FUN34/yaaH family-domain-containing protein [Tribonema minus]